jgi:prolyl-tRNA synthetase
MIGALIMTHSDDDGLVLPPKIASSHIVIIPIIHKEESRAEVLGCCHSLAGELRHVLFDGKPLVVIVDERELRSGEKTWNWIKKGVPIRIEVGPRDIMSDSFPVARRDKGHKETTPLSRGHLVAKVADILEDIQNNLYQKAVSFRNSHTKKIDRKEDFYSYFTPACKDQPEIHGGFALAHWCGDPAVEEQLKNDLSVTIRCIPIDSEIEEGICPFTGKKSAQRVIYAKSY